MLTPEEIDRRVEEKDALRKARRSEAAQQIAELAQRHASLVQQASDLERQLGDKLANNQDVIDVDELAELIEIPAAKLTQWLTTRMTRKTPPAKRKRPAAGTPDTGASHTSEEPVTPEKSTSIPATVGSIRPQHQTADTQAPTVIA